MYVTPQCLFLFFACFRYEKSSQDTLIYGLLYTDSDKIKVRSTTIRSKKLAHKLIYYGTYVCMYVSMYMNCSDSA